MKRAHHNVCVIHIGTTQLSAVRATWGDRHTLVAAESRAVPQYGFTRGVVQNVDIATKDIRALLEAFQPPLTPSADRFYVLVSSEFLKSDVYSSSLYFDAGTHRITLRDMQKVVSQTRAVATIPLSEIVIQALPQEYMVNDRSGIRHPVGLEASRLAVTLRLFTLNLHIVNDLRKVFEHNDIDVEALMPQGAAASMAVLRRAEEQDGVVVVDLGGELTSAAYIKDCAIRATQVLPVGAETITQALAKQFYISSLTARELKKRFGSTMRTPVFEDEYVPTGHAEGLQHTPIRLKDFQDVVGTTAQELLQALGQFIETVHASGGTFAQIVFTGGGAQLDGFLEMAQMRFGCPVRLGCASSTYATHVLATNPSYSAHCGVLKYISEQAQLTPELRQPTTLLTRVIAHTKHWIEDFF